MLVVDITDDNLLDLRLQLPPEHRRDPPSITLPPGCRVDRPAPALRAACDPDALRGDLVVRDLAPDLQLVVHLRRAGHPVRTALLHAAAPSLPLTPADSVLARYLRLGVEHILGGPDHLLFVAALVLWVRGAARLLYTLTAFTAAHSVTLALAALDLVRLPGPPVEACIAVSLVLLARAIVRSDLSRGTPDLSRGTPDLSRGTPDLSRGTPRAAAPQFAFACGLLHGFGFAGALADVGLPTGAVVPALAAFNLGVELGQVLVAVLVLVLVRLAHRRAPHLPLRRLLAYAIGCLASAWTVARVLALGTTA